MCLYAHFIDIQKPFTFSQIDIDDVRMWMGWPRTEINRKKTLDARGVSRGPISIATT